jgi:hypothetical protein
VKGGQEDVSLGMPPPLGEKGITIIAFLKRMKCNRIFTEQFRTHYIQDRNGHYNGIIKE